MRCQGDLSLMYNLNVNDSIRVVNGLVCKNSNIAKYRIQIVSFNNYAKVVVAGFEAILLH
jgi:hypothetical protein